MNLGHKRIATFTLALWGLMGASCGGGSTSALPPTGGPLAGLAGPDFTVRSLTAGVVAIVPGSLEVAECAWTQIGGPAVQLVGAGTPSAGFAAPVGATVLTFRATVTTSEGDVFSDEVAATVTGEDGVLFAHRSSFAVTGGGEARAEVIAHHPASQRIYIVNAVEGRVEVYHIANPAAPLFDGTLNSPLGNTTPNSVSISGNLVAVAFEDNVKQNPGTIQFFHAATRAHLGSAPTGALPDMVAFSPDGTRVATANEGEPSGDYTTDPEGSVTIVTLDRSNPDTLSITNTSTAGFSAFNGDLAALRAAGVRLFGPGATVAQDLEPEYLAFNEDGSEIVTTCQEANALAFIDVATATVTKIQPLGLKLWQGLDHALRSTVQTYNLPEMPVLGTTAGGQEVRLGGFSGLHLRGIDGVTGEWLLSTIPDRGPVLEPVNVDADGELERPYVLPNYTARIVHVRFQPTTGAVVLEGETPLVRTDGVTPITGRVNTIATSPGLAGYDEEPVDLLGDPVALDALGGDFEGLVRLPNGTWWLCDEYRPSLYHVAGNGTLLARLVPEGAGAAFGTESLPEAYGQRRINRGFEALAYDPTTDRIYAWIQSPLDVPDLANDNSSKGSRIVRIVAVDATTRETVGEYVHVLDCGAADKIGDAVWAGEAGAFFVIERDSAVGDGRVKKIVLVRIDGATNLQTAFMGAAYTTLAGPNGVLEGTPPTELEGLGVVPVSKVTHVDLGEAGYDREKAEGLALLPDGRFLVLNDNDFGMLGVTTNLATGLLTIPPGADAGTQLAVVTTTPIALDGSDRDGPGDSTAIVFAPRKVHGMYQPDSIVGFACGDAWFYIMANEGDARAYEVFDEESRVGSGPYLLDPTVFPDGAFLKGNEQIGRLRTTLMPVTNPGTLADGDTDGDGDQDRIQVYGARSFSIRDSVGNLVYDSGDWLERLTAKRDPARFNQNGAGAFDERSDDKGPEPEGATIGVIDGVTYAFIGLERHGGIVVFDVSEPAAPRYIAFMDHPNDANPEGLTFIAAADSPTGNPLLLAANEVSGTVSIYELFW